jgi:excisionase family DNA binding protein
METLIKETSKSDQELALLSLQKLVGISKKLNRSSTGEIEIKVETGEYITVPKKALVFLFAVLENMAQGKSITLISSESEITTQQAADILGVSRPHLVKLLESGEIHFKKAGSHRRILLKDLIDFKHKQARLREEQLEFLAKQAQSLKMGYE